MFFIKFSLSDKDKKNLQNFVDKELENLNITELGKVSMTVDEARRRRRIVIKGRSRNRQESEVVGSEC